MSATHYLAVDLGAESGRVILGTLQDDQLTIEEIHRFPNRLLTLDRHLHWDLNYLGTEIFAGIGKAAERHLPISGISTDSWAVDYVLLDAMGKPLAQPYGYRDVRTTDSSTRLFKKLPFAEIYQETGIQFMAINTLFQFESQQNDDPAVFWGPIIFSPSPTTSTRGYPVSRSSSNRWRAQRSFIIRRLTPGRKN